MDYTQNQPTNNPMNEWLNGWIYEWIESNRIQSNWIESNWIHIGNLHDTRKMTEKERERERGKKEKIAQYYHPCLCLIRKCALCGVHIKSMGNAFYLFTLYRTNTSYDIWLLFLLCFVISCVFIRTIDNSILSNRLQI